LPEGFEVPWNLLMGGQIIDLEKGVTIETFLSHENIPEDTDLNPYYIHVSPDGKWVAYQDTSHKKLYVEPIPTLLTKNEAVDRIVIEKDVRFHLERWVDNETVFYIYRDSMDTYVFPTVFHNVFSGKEYEFLLQDLPDYMSHHWGGAVIATHYLDGEVIPDPTMRMIVYPEMSNDPDVFATNTLWDVKNKQPLARLENLLYDFIGPLWSHDGSDLLILGPNPERRRYIHEEWFLLNTNGNIRQLTYFQDIFLDDSYSISNASRSTDDRYLVFQLSESTSRDESVKKTIVLDLNTKYLDGFCIESPVQVNSFRGSEWSPDSKFFTLSNVDRFNEGKIIIVDVENEVAYVVDQDTKVLGWIAKPEGEK